MAPIKSLLLFLLGTSTALAVPMTPKRQEGCKATKQRKAWHTMSNSEKKAYIDAELCIMSKPPKAGLRGAQTLFDEFQSLHAMQFELAHFVGSFLTWHRVMMWAHEYMLETECGYTAGQPWWDETHDAGTFSTSDVLDPVTGFGGDGVGTDRCIQDGPFANYTNHVGPGFDITDHCIQRSVNDRISSAAAQANIDNCMRQPTYEQAWGCIEGAPHSAGHAGVGAQLVNPQSSPGDPIFYLHHAWIDKLWWDWQARDLETRLTDMAGRNKQTGFGPGGFGGGGFGGFPGFGGGSGDNGGNGDGGAPGVPGAFVPPGGFGPPGSFNPPGGAGGFGGGFGGAGFGGPGFGGGKRPDDLPAPEAKGDKGGQVTLGHINEMLGIIPDMTTGEIMDIRSSPMCYEYVEPDKA